MYRFSSDSRAFLSAALDSYLTIWTTKDWKQSATLGPAPPPKAVRGEHQDEFLELQACAFNSNDPRVMVASGGDSIEIYSLGDGKRIRNHRTAINEQSLAISSDGLEIAAGRDSRVAVLSADTWKERVNISAGGEVSTLAYAPKSKLLAVAIHRGGIELWDTKRGTLVRKLRATGIAEQLSFSPDGQWLAVAIWGAKEKTNVRIWSVVTGAEEARLEGHSAEVWGVSFSPDGKFVVSSDTGGGVRLWRVSNWQACWNFSAVGGQQVAFSPDGLWLAVAGGTQAISLRNFRELATSCH